MVILGYCDRTRREFRTPELLPESPIAGVNGCFAGAYFVVPMSFVGRELQFG